MKEKVYVIICNVNGGLDGQIVDSVRSNENEAYELASSRNSQEKRRKLGTGTYHDSWEVEEHTLDPD